MAKPFVHPKVLDDPPKSNQNFENQVWVIPQILGGIWSMMETGYGTT